MRSFLSGILGRGTAAERGQALALFAMGLAGFIGLVGLSVDMGQIVVARTDLQKLADSATLAGVQDLPNASSATSSANTYGKAGAAAGTNISVTISQTYGSNDTIEVTASRRVNYWFLKAVGLDGMTVSARAKARAMNYAGGGGLLPWGFIASNDNNSKLLQNTCYTGQSGGVPTFQQGVACTIKYGAGTNSGGDFGALSLDGSGASVYRDTIKNGSTKTIKVGDKIDSETGNMQGPTDQGLSDRLALPAPTGCPGNSYSDVLSVTNGVASIRPGCENSPRIGIIPVVDKIANPQKSTVLGFAFVYINGTTGSGGGTKVDVYFVKYVTELPKGVYTGTTASGATAVKLVE
ncbi:MAG: hypothetical protein HY875_17425 [Chloroflexi bacterium]|nr:hypothetical protein [Chloroflexota bacterium]